MNVTELTKEIYEKYPKVWGKIYDENYCKLVEPEGGLYIHFTKEEILISSSEAGGEASCIPFNMLYGLLEDFFEENDIELILKKYVSTGIYYFSFLSIKDKNTSWYNDNKHYKTKIEAKQQAILKACEILEARL